MVYASEHRTLVLHTVGIFASKHILIVLRRVTEFITIRKRKAPVFIDP